MKTQNTLFLAPLKKNEVHGLTQEVKETVAAGMIPVKNPVVLTAADLWKIHRTAGAKVTRRFLV